MSSKAHIGALVALLASLALAMPAYADLAVNEGPVEATHGYVQKADDALLIGGGIDGQELEEASGEPLAAEASGETPRDGAEASDAETSEAPLDPSSPDAAPLETPLASDSLDALSAAEAAGLPARFDAREQGWVGSFVRQQNPWGSCWAISALQAMEANLAKQGKAPLGTTLSPRHLLMFAGTALPADPAAAAALANPGEALAASGVQAGQLAAQAGEGQHAVDWLVDTYGDNAPFELGGNFYVVYQAIASGVGPVLEQQAPYRNDEGIVEYGEGTSWYAPEGTWALSPGMRFSSVLQLNDAIRLASPAHYTASRGTSTYSFDEEAALKVKQAIMEHGSVAIAIDSSSSYYDKANNTVFTTDSRLDNHGVQIVGWDDTVSRELFTTGADGVLPEGDGAWIVRNSWGAPGQDFPNASDWSADGYFLLSYYDRSAQAFSAYSVGLATDAGATDIINQHDFFGQMGQSSARLTSSDLAFVSANVFTAECAQQLQAVSVDTYAADTDVTIQVYRLAADATAPDQGELLETVHTTIAQAGYHRVPLANSHALAAGERFSVVERVVEPTADGGALAVATIEAGNSRQAAELYGYYHHDTVVVNEGESYFFTSLTEGEALRWMDATQVGAALSSQSAVATPYGNACIKAFSKKDAQPDPVPTYDPEPDPEPTPDLAPSSDDAGEESSAPVQPAQPAQAAIPAKRVQASPAHATPPTGDDAPIVLVASLAGASLIALAGAIPARRARRRGPTE